MNKRREIELHFAILILLILIIISSVKIISLATDKIQEENKIAEDSTINQNVLVVQTEKDTTTDFKELEEKNEEVSSQKEIKKEEIKKDTKALAQINTTTRKTSSGRKYTSIGLINIPSLNIKYQILSSTSEELLKISVNKYWGPNPNEVGNMCLLGHNYKDSRFFGKLPKIQKGAKIYITDTDGITLTYKVYETDVVEEDDVSCTSQKTNGKKEITLITCYYEPGYRKATKRFIVKARAE